LSELREGKDMQENPQCILPHTLPDVCKKLDICIKGTEWSYSWQMFSLATKIKLGECG
jgi:hypothetical protein